MNIVTAKCEKIFILLRTNTKLLWGSGFSTFDRYDRRILAKEKVAFAM